MRYFKSIKLTFITLALLFLTSCSSMVSIAPSTTPITEKDVYTKLGYSCGRAYGIILLWFLPICEPNPSYSARKSAIKSGGGNALIEVTEENNVFSLLLVTITWTTVEGTAVKIEKRGMEIED